MINLARQYDRNRSKCNEDKILYCILLDWYKQIQKISLFLPNDEFPHMITLHLRFQVHFHLLPGIGVTAGLS